MSTLTCHGCGATLALPKGPGRQPKWCSDRCRKRQYASTCMDCGATVNANGSAGTDVPDRCVKCQAQISGEAKRNHEFMDAVAQAFRDGAKLREIAAEFDLSMEYLHVLLWRMRNWYGYDLPRRYRVDENGRRLPDEVAA